MGAILSEDESDVEVEFGDRCGRKEVESCAVCGGCGLLKMGFFFLAEGQVGKSPKCSKIIVAKLLGHCGVGVGL